MLGHLVDQDFHCLQRSLNTRDLSLPHHKHVDNFVDALALRDPGLLGHLADRDPQSLQCSLNLRDLSLQHHRRIDNLVDVINLRELGMLGHLGTSIVFNTV